MTWWCTATRTPWSWTPRAYPGVWAFIAVIVVAGLVAVRRTGLRLTGRQRAAWVGGVAALWIATDWPVGTLGSGYLAAVHMAQYMLYTFVAAPLLLLAVPEQLAARLVGTGRARDALRAVARPLPAALVANGVLLFTHAPWTVDTVRSTQVGSFALDVVWLLGGLVLWMPILSPLREDRATPLVQCVYLFLAAGLVPMVPGGFLTFADTPLYGLYELAPRVGDIDPRSDQQTAGVLMKVGNLPLIWPVIAVIFVRAAQAGTVGGPPRQKPAPRPTTQLETTS